MLHSYGKNHFESWFWFYMKVIVSMCSTYLCIYVSQFHLILTCPLMFIHTIISSRENLWAILKVAIFAVLNLLVLKKLTARLCLLQDGISLNLTRIIYMIDMDPYSILGPLFGPHYQLQHIYICDLNAIESWFLAQNLRYKKSVIPDYS